MEKKLKTVLFFGTDNFSAITLRALIVRADELNIKLGGVITRPDARKGRGRTLESPITKVIAEEAGIPVYQPANSEELYDAVTTASYGLAEAPLGVLVSYGRIIPQRVIDLFTPGIINLHPSLLPLYRGPSPVETSILNGDAKTGVSVMQLSAAMDAGPVYLQSELQMNGSETGPALLSHLGEIGTELLCGSLKSIIDGSLVPVEQNDDAATYCHLLSKEQARVDPEIHTASEIDRHIRAYQDFPKTKLTIAEQQVVLHRASLIDQEPEDTSALILNCKDTTLLQIDELTGPSGKRMSGQAFKNGYLR